LNPRWSGDVLISVIFSDKLPGYGFIGGWPPPDPNPDGYDGRAKVMNVPSAMRITVHDASAPLAPILRQAWSRTDGTWHIGALPTETRLLVMFWNDGQYTTVVGGETHPLNSFAQDHIHATPYDEA
jgi:hypothetical protein